VHDRTLPAWSEDRADLEATVARPRGLVRQPEGRVVVGQVPDPEARHVLRGVDGRAAAYESGTAAVVDDGRL